MDPNHLGHASKSGWTQVALKGPLGPLAGSTQNATRKESDVAKRTMKQGSGNRRRGAEGERELAGVLREFGWNAKRGQQRSGLEQADVVDGPPGWHFECKRTEALNVWSAFAQASRDRQPGEVPVVATRRNNSPWLAVLDLRTLLRLVQANANAPLPRDPAEVPTRVAPPKKRAPRASQTRPAVDPVALAALLG